MKLLMMQCHVKPACGTARKQKRDTSNVSVRYIYASTGPGPWPARIVQDDIVDFINYNLLELGS